MTDAPNNSRLLTACIRLFVKKCRIKRSVTRPRHAGQTNAGRPHGTEGGTRLMHAHTNISRHSSPHRCDPVSLATPRLMRTVSLGSEGDSSKQQKNSIQFKTHRAASFLKNGNDGQWRRVGVGGGVVVSYVYDGERGREGHVHTRKQ